MQPEEGVWSLEDLDSIIKLDLRTAQSSMRLFTEGSLVILEGELVQGLFKVKVSHTHNSPPSLLQPCNHLQQPNLFFYD